MEDLNKNQIDELFSASLGDANIQFVEANWMAMKQKLVKHEKREGFAWWTSASGIAAALLIAMVWWNMDEQVNTAVKVARQPIKHNVKFENPGNRNASIEEKAQTGKPLASGTQQFALNNNAGAQRIVKTNRKYRLQLTGRSKEGLHSASNSINKTQTEKYQVDVSIDEENAKEATPKENIIIVKAHNQPANISPKETDTVRATINIVKKFRPSFILTMSAAPDASAVKSFKDNKIGLSGGMLATVTLLPRLSITTGAILAKKIYATDYANYKPSTTYKFPVNPQTVSADCRVLDIPLNINYTLFQKGDSGFELSMGASSYLMLTEKYKYAYSGGYTKWPQSYQVRNINKHYFGVGNIAVAYQRKLNANTSLSIQPYLKLPLTDIGYGNVKLLSTGVAFNLNMNLSTITGKK